MPISSPTCPCAICERARTPPLHYFRRSWSRRLYYSNAGDRPPRKLELGRYGNVPRHAPYSARAAHRKNIYCSDAKRKPTATTKPRFLQRCTHEAHDATPRYSLPPLVILGAPSLASALNTSASLPPCLRPVYINGSAKIGTEAAAKLYCAHSSSLFFRSSPYRSGFRLARTARYPAPAARRLLLSSAAAFINVFAITSPAILAVTYAALFALASAALIPQRVTLSWGLITTAADFPRTPADFQIDPRGGTARWPQPSTISRYPHRILR